MNFKQMKNKWIDQNKHRSITAYEIEAIQFGLTYRDKEKEKIVKSINSLIKMAEEDRLTPGTREWFLFENLADFAEKLELDKK